MQKNQKLFRWIFIVVTVLLCWSIAIAGIYCITQIPIEGIRIGMSPLEVENVAENNSLFTHKDKSYFYGGSGIFKTLVTVTYSEKGYVSGISTRLISIGRTEPDKTVFAELVANGMSVEDIINLTNIIPSEEIEEHKVQIFSLDNGISYVVSYSEDKSGTWRVQSCQGALICGTQGYFLSQNGNKPILFSIIYNKDNKLTAVENERFPNGGPAPDTVFQTKLSQGMNTKDVILTLKTMPSIYNAGKRQMEFTSAEGTKYIFEWNEAYTTGEWTLKSVKESASGKYIFGK